MGWTNTVWAWSVEHWALTGPVVAVIGAIGTWRFRRRALGLGGRMHDTLTDGTMASRRTADALERLVEADGRLNIEHAVIGEATGQGSDTARLRAALRIVNQAIQPYREGHDSVGPRYELVVTNIGQHPAHDLTLEIVSCNDMDDRARRPAQPLDPADLHPAHSLLPRREHRVDLGFLEDHPPGVTMDIYEVRASWRDGVKGPNGDDRQHAVIHLDPPILL